VANDPGKEYHDNKKGVLCKPPGTQWFLYIPCVLILIYCVLCPNIGICTGARGSVVGSDTMLQAGRLRVRFPMRSLDFLN
jgi:hypothetical protein